MKKVLLGATLFLLVSSTHVFAAGHISQKGQPHGVINILSTQLPVALLADIKKDYKEYWITELSEEAKGKHADYFITLENADQIVQLHSSGSGKWVVVSTSVKAD